MRLLRLEKKRTDLQREFRLMMESQDDDPKALCKTLEKRGADLVGVLSQHKSIGQTLPPKQRAVR